MLLAALLAAGSLADWALLNAVWRGDAAACAQAAGACWAAVGENLPLLLFGAMQPAHRGPALVACAALLLAVAVALGAGRLSGRARAGVAIAALALAAGALSGWPWGGEAIGPLRWGGLLVTLILAIAALLAAVPLAAGLALLRRSSSPAGSFAAATLIEAVRGVPLVTQLLFASFVLPMLLGGGVSKFSMALAALTLHTACLLAEVLRGALQAIPPGQMAAARALGMGSALAYQAVIWPQARRIAAGGAGRVRGRGQGHLAGQHHRRVRRAGRGQGRGGRHGLAALSRRGLPGGGRAVLRGQPGAVAGGAGDGDGAALNGRPQKRSSRIAGSTSSRTKAASDRLSSARTIATTSCTGASVPSPRRLASSRATASPSSVFR